MELPGHSDQAVVVGCWVDVGVVDVELTGHSDQAVVVVGVDAEVVELELSGHSDQVVVATVWVEAMDVEMVVMGVMEEEVVEVLEKDQSSLHVYYSMYICNINIVY